jgi:hypothetical protein
MSKKKPHKHADLIHAWADGAEIQFKGLEGWFDACNPDWLDDTEYRIKPKTININGFEVPEPVREPLERGRVYFIVSVTSVNSSDSCGYIKHFWKDDQSDRYWLQAGLIHLTPEASIQHTKALLSFTDKLYQKQ